MLFPLWRHLLTVNVVADYKFLGVLKRQFPDVPILGLTATATDHVVNDVTKILNIPQCLVFRASFNRANLFYEVRELQLLSSVLLSDEYAYSIPRPYATLVP